VIFLLCLLMQGTDLPSPLEESIRVEYVLLDVLALDGSGNPVTDLTRADFTVREGRKKIEIQDFTHIDLRQLRRVEDTLESMPTGTSAPVAARETGVQKMVLVVDLEDVFGTDVKRTIEQLVDFVETLPGNMPYTFRVFSLLHGEATDGWVTNRVLIREALEQIRDRWITDNVTTIAGENSDTTLLGKMDRDRGPRLGFQRGDDFALLGKALQDCVTMNNTRAELPNLHACLDLALDNWVDYHRMRSERVMGELYALVNALGDDPDIKNLLMVTPGFSLAGVEAALLLRDAAMKRARYTGPADARDRIDFFHFQKEVERAYKNLLHFCLARRVVINAFDIYNRRETLSYGDASTGFRDSLVKRAYTHYHQELNSGPQILADQTGGEQFETMRIVTSMNRIIDRSRYYYRIGYQSPSGRSGKWRNIQVDVARRGIKLIHRSGYFGR